MCRISILKGTYLCYVLSNAIVLREIRLPSVITQHLASIYSFIERIYAFL